MIQDNNTPQEQRPQEEAPSSGSSITMILKPTKPAARSENHREFLNGTQRTTLPRFDFWPLQRVRLAPGSPILASAIPTGSPNG